MLLAPASTLQKLSPRIYVLACEHNTFYVGFSRYLHNRLKCHWIGAGAFFTKKHKPLRVLEIRPAKNERDEFELWKHYAARYGYLRVGGWSEHLCGEFGFKWPRLPKLTKAEYEPTMLFKPKFVDLSLLEV